jgi:hypothetical protein
MAPVTPESNAGDVTGRGRERGVMAVMTGGSHLSARRGVSWGTDSGLKKVGRGLVFFSGPVWFPGVQIIFILFSSFFFYSDLSFENALSFRFE